MDTTQQEKQEELCVICLDKAADTMVLPCEHSVVCHACSKKLESTNDARLCVQCRRPIEHKLV